ncbi:MAG: DUF2283 domain-containing protein [Saprospiraceae bacterium]|nr:DUF2283 domain-containing protein [Saprospiraceae bacterium]MCB0627576.1 DUF2283 domain-containing protein [Saprospiraceae bacterium]
MKIKYDIEVDVLIIRLSDEKVVESDESKKGVIIDYDKDGNVVSIEILDVSKKSGSPMKVEYELTPK